MPGSSNEGTSALAATGPQRYSDESRTNARWMPNGMCGRPRSSRSTFAAAGRGTIRLPKLAMPFSIDSATLLDRVVHAEVVAVDDQHPGVRREAQQLTRQSAHDTQVCPTSGYESMMPYLPLMPGRGAQNSDGQ